MTSSSKFTWGLILNIGGFAFLIIGIALSATVCGAVLGIPMIVIGLPSLIVGIVMLVSAKSQKAQEAISAGVQQGIQAAMRDSKVPPLLPKS